MIKNRKVHKSIANWFPLCNNTYDRVINVTKQTRKVTCKKCLRILKSKKKASKIMNDKIGYIE